MFIGDPTDPDDTAKYGGEKSDFANTAGKIVLVSRGNGVAFTDKQINADAAKAAAIIVYNNVDGFDSFSVLTGGVQTVLPQKEFLLLYKLVSSPGHIFTRQQLMDDIWGIDTHTDPRTVDVHINRLRDRFRENQDFEIITVRGIGYKAERKHEEG